MLSPNHRIDEEAHESDADRSDVASFLAALHPDGEVREVRILGQDRYRTTSAGWFDNADDILKAIRAWDGRENIYLSLNPVEPALLARANRRIVQRVPSTTSDKDILRRRWLPLDIDPIRPSGISSTDTELAKACEVKDATVGFLDEQGWPDPLVAMSGNGYLVLYPIDLPNSGEATALVSGVLSGMAERFDTEHAHIDPSVSNASRIVCLIGTKKLKGDELEGRLHRRSKVLSVPADRSAVVTEDQLRAIAKSSAEPEQRAGKLRVLNGGKGLRQMLADAGIEVREQSPDANGIIWYHVERCPFHDDGRPFECGVGQKLPDGSLAGKCFHPEGDGKGWQEWKVELGLGARTRTRPRATVGALPTVVVNDRPLRDIEADAWAALIARNNPARFFVHGGSLAEVRSGDDGPEIVHLDVPSLRACVDRVADWVRETKEGTVPAAPPKPVLEDMLAYPAEGLPVLRGVAGRPTLARDGELELQPGYHESSGIFYEPVGSAIPEVPEVPTPEDIDRAVSWIRSEWLVDFPFATEASLTHTVAAGLTAIARELFEGPTPLFAFDAPAPGTGKGHAGSSVAIIVSGRDPTLLGETRAEDELRKRTTSLLQGGAEVVLLDNAKRRVDSPNLAAVLTATTWSDRLLGTNRISRLPNRSLWMVTGNNLRIDGDLARRTVWVRLDAKVDRPWERDVFKHDPFLPWVRRQRHELLWSLLVLCRHWIATGRPPWFGKPMGSYEDWSAVVGGILELVGFEGFLGNREELYGKVDEESEEWRAFVAAWWESHTNTPVGVAELYPLVSDGALLPGLYAGVPGELSERSMKTRLGKALKEKVDRGFGGIFIRQAGRDANKKTQLYRLEPGVDPTGPASPAEVPQQSGPDPDSVAGGAVPAVPEPQCNMGDSPGDSAEVTGEVANNVPQVPQVPQSGSEPPGADAGPGAGPPTTDGGRPPRSPRVPCRGGCGELVPEGQKCRGCTAKAVSEWRRGRDGRRP